MQQVVFASPSPLQTPFMVKQAHARFALLATLSAWCAMVASATTILAGLLLLQGSVPVQPVLLWGPALAAAVCAGVSWAAAGVRRRFEFTDYVHAER